MWLWKAGGLTHLLWFLWKRFSPFDSDFYALFFCFLNEFILTKLIKHTCSFSHIYLDCTPPTQFDIFFTYSVEVLLVFNSQMSVGISVLVILNFSSFHTLRDCRSDISASRRPHAQFACIVVFAFHLLFL